MAYEFLYLLANCIDKIEYFRSVPKPGLDISRDKFRLFNIDNEQTHIARNPNAKI